MSRQRRLVSMLTGSIALGGLGFVVAVAAQSRPDGGDEPWLDLAFRSDVDLSPILAWIVLIAVVVWAVLFALGLGSRPVKQQPRRRKVLGTLVALLLVVVVIRWLRPDVDIALLEPAPVGDSVAEQTETANGSWSGWTLFVLLAAVFAAALTRIGLSIGSAPISIQEEVENTTPEEFVLTPMRAEPRRRALGDDPASQILNAYGSFEDAVSNQGAPRLDTETESRHARRARRMLGLKRADVDILLRLHADTRYGDASPSRVEADQARDIVGRLLEEIRE
jgi:hypothetical protein